jgi:hypothetical protein
VSLIEAQLSFQRGNVLERSKYNVDKDTEKRTCNGIVFDSVLEMRYYRDIILPGVESGNVKKYELQKKYVLIDGFQRNGKRVLPITYVADFYVEYADGHIQVVDIKGMPDTTAKLKRKLFWYVYPDIDYVWITYVKKYGGWGLYDDFAKRRRDEKREKKLNKTKIQKLENKGEQM